MQTVKSRDEELVELYLRSGERVHLEELTERHLARIRMMVYSMLLNHAQADDVTQEIFLKVYRSLPAFEGRSKFTTWLYRIAVNTVHSHLDRQNRSPVSFQTNVPEPAETANPVEALGEQEIHNRLEAALAELSPKLRAAVVLVCLEERDAAEVAEIEDCSVSTIYWRVHEARKQLSARLEEFL